MGGLGSGCGDHEDSYAGRGDCWEVVSSDGYRGFLFFSFLELATDVGSVVWDNGGTDSICFTELSVSFGSCRCGGFWFFMYSRVGRRFHCNRRAVNPGQIRWRPCTDSLVGVWVDDAVLGS